MSKWKAIIIDDEEDFCFLLSQLLEATGKFEVLYAHDGNQGRNLVLEKQPDLIFLDYVMPRMRGDEVIEALRKDERAKNIPIIITSGLGEAAYIQKIVQKEKDLGKVIDEEGRLPLPRELNKAEEAQLTGLLGAQGFLEKPFSRDALLEIVRKVLKDQTI